MDHKGSGGGGWPSFQGGGAGGEREITRGNGEKGEGEETTEQVSRKDG